METFSEPPPSSSEAAADPDMPSRPVIYIVPRPKRRLPPPKKRPRADSALAGGEGGEKKVYSLFCSVFLSGAACPL